MRFHLGLMWHFQLLQDWVARHNGRATLNILDFRLEIAIQDRVLHFFPRFIAKNQGRIVYTRILAPQVQGFIGWLPYEEKIWVEAQDKLEFKRLLLRHNERTPEFWLNTDKPVNDVLIKPAKGSFGMGQRGPFRKIDPDNESHKLKPGEFYERFIPGQILKVWYWNAEPFCVDLRKRLTVTGDGYRSVATLVNETFLRNEGLRSEWFETTKPQLNALLAYQDANWETVLSPGVVIQVDYAFGSSLYVESADLAKNFNRLNEIRGTPLGQKLMTSGTFFQNIIPEAIRNDSVFAVDGMVDSNGDLWWLEMNCAPAFPPDGYPTMLGSLFKQ